MTSRSAAAAFAGWSRSRATRRRTRSRTARARATARASASSRRGRARQGGAAGRRARADRDPRVGPRSSGSPPGAGADHRIAGRRLGHRRPRQRPRGHRSRLGTSTGRRVAAGWHGTRERRRRCRSTDPKATREPDRALTDACISSARLLRGARIREEASRCVIAEIRLTARRETRARARSTPECASHLQPVAASDRWARPSPAPVRAPTVAGPGDYIG